MKFPRRFSLRENPSGWCTIYLRRRQTVSSEACIVPCWTVKRRLYLSAWDDSRFTADQRIISNKKYMLRFARKSTLFTPSNILRWKGGTGAFFSSHRNLRVHVSYSYSLVHRCYHDVKRINFLRSKGARKLKNCLMVYLALCHKHLDTYERDVRIQRIRYDLLQLRSFCSYVADRGTSVKGDEQCDDTGMGRRKEKWIFNSSAAKQREVFEEGARMRGNSVKPDESPQARVGDA